ncbi:MAG: helix-turn-helix domain-containing protein [Gammaproteobacteria bacterium]|nr:helix-turn-helix domain-containing protein [Gammaproteobacteria bacterium]
MPQGQLPLFPLGFTEITSVLAFKQADGKVTYFNGLMPVFVHEADDESSFRMITAQFCANGFVKQAQIARAFGVTPISVKRSVKRFREEGPAGFYRKRKTRGAAVLTPDVLEAAQQLFDQEYTIPAVAQQLGIKPNTLSKAVKAGHLRTRTKKKNLPS